LGKEGKIMLKAQAWMLRDGSESYTYRLQMDYVGSKSHKKIFEIMEGWSKAGTILYQNKETEQGFIFQRTFTTEQEWKNWGKNFPYKLVEISSISDRVKATSLGCKEHKKVGRPSGRRCGKCGKLGHNARTCKGEEVAKKPSTKSRIPRKHRKKCSICGTFDHNARTCEKRKNETTKTR
jgi:hypothetical protein